MSTTARLHPEIAEFAAAVREQLADLDPEEVEELTGGLEADLEEQANDDTGFAAPGDPAAYALELRTAAGLPPRPARNGVRARWAELGTAMSAHADDLARRLRRNRAAAATLDFLMVLRPLWWLLRAWVVYQVLHLLFRTNQPGGRLPETPLGWSVLVAVVVVSVQWGRGEWLPLAWMRHLVAAVSVLAVVALPSALDHAKESSQIRIGGVSSQIVSTRGPSQPGLTMNGRQVRNVFAYDAQGRPLSGVQLYDQDGDPLSIGERLAWNWELLPATLLRTGDPAWNVFPLRRLDREDTVYDSATGTRVPRDGAQPETVPPPLRMAPEVAPTPAGGAPDGSDDAHQQSERSGPDPSESGGSTS